jgi:hypothetical protein
MEPPLTRCAIFKGRSHNCKSSSGINFSSSSRSFV